MTSDPVILPGFGLPLAIYDPYEHFPKAIAYWAGEAATVRERTMLALMDGITDKPEWDRKIFDESIIQKWRREAVDSDMDVSEKMLDWVCYTSFIDFNYLIPSGDMILYWILVPGNRFL